MNPIPRRQSLVSQTATILRDEIVRGGFREWLPGERVLCHTLQVSRNTLRAALAQLKQEGLLRSDHGSGNRILAAPMPQNARALKNRNVALLTPEALERLRPSQTLWIDELRAMLSERGGRLHVFSGAQYFRAAPAAALAKLVSQHRHACWILTLSNTGTQTWFEENRIPAIVAGSVYPGRKLPFRDLDHRAICRHAAGTLIAKGHRRLGLLLQKSRRAGDLESEEGFLEGVRQSSQPDVSAFVANHDATVGGIKLAVRRLMQQADAPTALLIINPLHYLAAATQLLQMGKRIPEDVSLVCRDDDPFLSFVVPEPARYRASPHGFAKSLLKPVLELLESEAVSQEGVKLMPEFLRGASIAPLA